MNDTARPVRINSMEDAETVIGAAKACAKPAWIVSAENGGAYAGGGWLKALWDQLREDFPGTEIRATLDCGDESGRVLAALRAGVKDILFTGDAETLNKLRDIAAEYDATLRDTLPDTLETQPDGIDRRRCMAFMSEDESAGI